MPGHTNTGYKKPPPSSLTPEEQAVVRENNAFWRLFMPRESAGVPVDTWVAGAYVNVIDTVLDMLQDALAEAPQIRQTLTFASEPPFTAEQLLQKVRAHFDFEQKPKAA